MVRRLWRHITTTKWELHRDFPDSRLNEIAAAVKRVESQRRGQIVVALEAALHMDSIYERTTARTRATQLFSMLRVWDTEFNNGVLIYLLLADHAIEILADRNAARTVSQAQWDQIAKATADLCAKGRYSDAILQAVEQVQALLPPDQPQAIESNELPDRPIIL
jgi:uncharacterized membrane protein